MKLRFTTEMYQESSLRTAILNRLLRRRRKRRKEEEKEEEEKEKED